MNWFTIAALINSLRHSFGQIHKSLMSDDYFWHSLISTSQNPPQDAILRYHMPKIADLVA